MATKKTPKPVVLTPKVPKKKKKEEPPKTKRSVIVHKTEKPPENLYQMLAEVEKTIAELTRLYTETQGSKHRGVGGREKPTLKQEQIAKQLEQAQTMAERLMKLIEKVES